MARLARVVIPVCRIMSPNVAIGARGRSSARTTLYVTDPATGVSFEEVTGSSRSARVPTQLIKAHRPT
ncbi:MAG: hypothetical protein U0942_04585 [Parvibaculum sp.]|uniref:hypothetical protein n=1 Tax=Parvibaculum sp. TaxID=2024848 RepID=UPI002AB87BF0|nr:hypothetical protein [Parvibaculum sp.]MDZ4380599.1 hypothetical protein [Parvibaculum sp.]